MQARPRNERGFSLIELMVAMTVTLIVSGAIYGLIAGGQSAFRREPELSDRQQNIRVAMDMMLRDIANAGSGMPDFVQTFTPGLDGCAACPMGPDNVRTDELEVLTNSGALENEAACFVPMPSGGPMIGASNAVHQVAIVRNKAPLAADTAVILLMTDGTWTMRNLVAATPDTAPLAPPMPNVIANCDMAANHTLLDFGATGDTTGLNVDASLCTPTPAAPPGAAHGNTATACDVMEVSFGEVVRYRIRTDPAGVPLLQRSTSADPGAGFQTLARGIEDLQVQYIPAIGDPTDPADWVDDAPPVTPADYTTMLTQVRVTLSARSEAQNVQGATMALTGPARMRGRLTATASPRSSLLALSRQPIPSPAPVPLPSWWWR
jgi:prepilin-type N-terminal cleavage/methylation domain-containing protein